MQYKSQNTGKTPVKTKYGKFTFTLCPIIPLFIFYNNGLFTFVKNSCKAIVNSLIINYSYKENAYHIVCECKGLKGTVTQK